MAEAAQEAPMTTAQTIRDEARPLTGATHDYDSLMELVGDARIVLLGEATHGTHEFYRERARITQRLIEEHGFTVVAVEADWPDAYEVNRWVRGVSDDRSDVKALAGFERFPTWMWRNRDVLHFVSWLRDYNGDTDRKAGFYGLDLYSLFASMDAVIDFLNEVDPEAAKRARFRYACFEQFGEDSQAYGYSAGFGLTPTCEDQAVQQLVDVQRRAAEQPSAGGGIPEDELFYAEQNARLVKNAEEYYRTMFRGRVSSWNLRDRHMAETLDALLAHFDRKGARSGERTRAVVWAHNSHIGDARATSMGEMGEWNLGQLVRERFGDEARLVGFTTYTGTVTAASDWDEPPALKRVRPALPGSIEALLHDASAADFLLPLRGRAELSSALAAPRLERAIGVVYRSESERVSHYFDARLPQQFDAVIHFDTSQAVEPLDPGAGWKAADVPETYPSAL
jgi:erythromycin esterase-like protein